MKAYRFRILTEANEEFLREIDVLASQTFEDFHKAIVETVKLKGNELASFYICDHAWRKKSEIALMDMNFDENSTVAIMKDTKLNTVIFDPHQKLIYVYDYMNMFTFEMELVKIQDEDPKTLYPKVVKSMSDIQMSMSPVPPVQVAEDEENTEMLYSEDELDDINSFSDEGDESEEPGIGNIDEFMEENE